MQCKYNLWVYGLRDKDTTAYLTSATLDIETHFPETLQSLAAFSIAPSSKLSGRPALPVSQLSRFNLHRVGFVRPQTENVDLSSQWS